MKRSQKTPLFLAAFFIVLGTAFSFYYYRTSQEIKKPKVAVVSGPGQYVRPFRFVNQEGDTVTRAVMDGKIAVVEYFFTTCKGICPIMNEQMARVYEAYRNADDVVILSHTVDPETDDVEALKAYSLQYDADPKRWLFLTGDKKELYDQARYSYLISADDSTVQKTIDEDFIHSNLFVLVDPLGRLRMHLDPNGNPKAYDGTDSESVSKLIQDIQLLREEK